MKQTINSLSNINTEINSTTRYVILQNDGATTEIYHGMYNRGKGKEKTPIFLTSMRNLGKVYPHTYKSKSWAIRMIHSCIERSERRTPFGIRTFSLWEITTDAKGNAKLGKEIKF